MLKKITFTLLSCLFLLGLFAQNTQVKYLSGKGPNDAVAWKFFCTSGMNSNKWTTILVPSCWEQQGFGKYDYGFAKDSIRGKETGFYQYRFKVDPSWKNKQVNIVFEGVMTDAAVKINGKQVGPSHHGAFYSFSYNITSFINFETENELEVRVDKHSDNNSVNEAERKGDFWIFGGIFRPVFLEALPQEHIAQVKINAQYNGEFDALVTTTNFGGDQKLVVEILDAQNKVVANYKGNAQTNLIARIQGKLPNAKPWTPETPNLYTAKFIYYTHQKITHTVYKKFGYRTVEVKPRDGIYVNGVQVKMKGVNRHSFRPETARTLSYQNSVEDVLLMKAMNMNAVRMSHYPPDEHFLQVCDSLGLFVLDELAGWHGNYNTNTGKKLLKELIDHDGNHPSIVLWANGNEGGHNVELDPYFDAFDWQKRVVIHPWQLFNGIETQHYREYNYGIGNYENGKEILMPTEFLHGQFDGGHGAGLEDYWEKMWHNPLSAGGFLWDFADNAIMRKDLHDSLDTDKHRAADGILGPHHEKEGSFYTIKEVWSPIYVLPKIITPTFNGNINIENRYHYTNTRNCSFTWKLAKLARLGTPETMTTTGTITSPSIAPGAKGSLQIALPTHWKNFDVLYLTATDPFGKEIFTWSFPIQSPTTNAVHLLKVSPVKTNIQTSETDTSIQVKANGVFASFNKKTGLLISVTNGKGIIPFTNGPVLDDAATNFKDIISYTTDSSFIIESVFDKKTGYNKLRWNIFSNGIIQLTVQYFPASYFTNYVGLNFSFPEKAIDSVTYMGDGPYRVWKNRIKGNAFGVWTKKYNKTETGEAPWLYPEFKGYHSNFYAGQFYTKGNSFSVFTETESVYLRLFTPAFKTDQWHNYEPLFPTGDISFMQGISSIGSKTQRNETTGPMGQKNIFYDYEKDPSRALKMVLYFDFN
jgi:hypothetical protein